MKPSIELPKIGCPAEIAVRFKDFEKWDNVKNVKKVYLSLVLRYLLILKMVCQK